MRTSSPERPAIEVRPARPEDAPAVAEIYNEGIRGRGATFETAERTTADVLAWFESASHTAGGHRHPFLVAVDGGGAVIGWVRASAYRPRACYAGIAEFSVYVSAAARRSGVGDALMAAFVPACADAGIWKILSRIFPENAAPLALCARHGFRTVGTYEKHAKLDGVWRDVVIVERLFPQNLT
jgi:phosphinothricin acetyltransferase